MLFYIVPTILFVYLSISSYGKMYRMYDIHREFFFPLSVLNGEVLYKDIFNIFGPFPYYFNALLYKLFGIHLSTLYVAGVVNTAIILIFSYLIARKFLSKKVSMAIIVFTMACAFSATLMNYINPYTYAMVYGYSTCLVSVYFFLEYLAKIITNRKSDNYYNIFTPDRVEAYGEAKIIEHYAKTKPEYFIITDQEQLSYNKSNFCTYAQNVCRWIGENYTKELWVGNEHKIVILKRKDLK